MSTTCASCNAPLDLSEQLSNIENANLYCTRSKSPDHLPIACQHCGEKFPHLNALKNHIEKLIFTPATKNQAASWGYHASFRCAIEECPVPVVRDNAHKHFKDFHRVQYPCAECGALFRSLNRLDRHGDETCHAAYVCRYPECGAECTRVAELNRHQLTHKTINVARYPCPHCRK